jgi:hypothetical protein
MDLKRSVRILLGLQVELNNNEWISSTELITRDQIDMFYVSFDVNGKHIDLSHLKTGFTDIDPSNSCGKRQKVLTGGLVEILNNYDHYSVEQVDGG